MNFIKKINLTQNRPQVLLIGNGPTRSAGYTWHEFIKSCAREDIDVEKYRNGNGFHLPNTVLSLAVMDRDDSIRHNRYIKELNTIKYKENSYINKLLKIPFDSILTTNYTYEIEYAIKSNYPQLTEVSKKKYAASLKPDAKYLIHTYNAFENKPPIWHIHGEVRRKNSLILSHDEYARLTNKIIEYSNTRKDDYVFYNQDIHVKSWIDYFILGDLYILGFGFDYAEFDLWWLVNRRLREKANCGEIYFYEPEVEENHYKLLAMKDMGIKVETLNIKISADEKDSEIKYNDFYNKAILDIAVKVGGNRNGKNSRHN